MCGICGVVTGTISQNEASIFKKLLYMCAFRGMDSTGIFAVQGEKDHKTPFIKDIGDPMSFMSLYNKEFEDDLHTKSAKALVGHTRHATKGDVNKENAHPFDFEHVIGVHNGTLWTNPQVNGKSAETDSESLYAFMNRYGLEATLSEMSGSGDAYTLVFFDKKKKTLNAIRNDKRPLSFVPVSGASTIFWASEAGMLRWVLDRENIKYEEVYTIHPNYLLSFDMTTFNPALNYDITKIKVKPKVYQVPVRRSAWEGNPTPPFLARENSSHDHTGRSTTTTHTSANSAVSASMVENAKQGLSDWEEALNDSDDTLVPLQYDPATNKLVPKGELSKSGIAKGPVSKPDSNVVPIKKKDTSVHHHQGGFYWIGNRGFTKEEFERKLMKGCAWCSQQADLTDKIDWMNLEDYFCQDCKDNPQVEEYRGLYHATSGR